jgi:hypothetical protein
MDILNDMIDYYDNQCRQFENRVSKSFLQIIDSFSVGEIADDEVDQYIKNRRIYNQLIKKNGGYIN